MKYLRTILGLLVLLFTACSKDAPRSASEGTASMPMGDQPTAHGDMNHVLVICDSSLWAGPVGDSFLYYFNAPYIILPKPEPIFDLQQMTPEALARQPLNKAFRTIVFLADISDEESSTASLLRADLGTATIDGSKKGKSCNVSVGQDKWAIPQQIFYTYGFGEKKLAQCINDNFPAIAQSINEKDQAAIRAITYKDGEDYKLQDEVLAKYHLHIKIPKGFEQAGLDANSNTVWLRKDVGDNSYNLLLRKLPNFDKSQFTEAEFRKIREATTQAVGQGMAGVGSSIIASDLPLFLEEKTFNNGKAIQARGVWRDGHYNGPFVSNLLLDPNTNGWVLVDGFTLTKDGRHRNLIQELDLILATASF